MPQFVFPGVAVAIPAGKRIIRNGVPARQGRSSVVTVQKTEPDRRGKTRIYWKSQGYTNSALV